MRVFNSGSIRSSDHGKLNYFGFREPLIEQSFSRYMEKHRVCEDGSLRDANNWWKGWDVSVSVQSLVRHTEDLQALEAGYNVFKLRDDKGEKTIYTKNKKKTEEFQKDIRYLEVDKEETANAIRFNTSSYLLQILKDN